jgi:hypothetical protein
MGKTNKSAMVINRENLFIITGLFSFPAENLTPREKEL